MKDEADFEAYVSVRWAVLVRSAMFLGCSAPEAEDLVQTTLLRCYRSWEAVMKAESRDAYVYRMMLNAHASSRSRLWHGERPSSDRMDDHESAVDVAEEVTASIRMRDALHLLSADHRAVLVLRYYADLSEREVAGVLGVAVGTVKSRSARALSGLMVALGESSTTRGAQNHE